jgi:hypothetical protein
MGKTLVITLSDGAQVGVTVTETGEVTWIAERPTPGACWSPPLAEAENDWRFTPSTFVVRT